MFLFAHAAGIAQSDKGLLPYFNKLLLNPSYAGFNKDTHVGSELLFFAQPERNLNHSYTLTYDKWSEPLKTGMAFYFYQGLAGKVNTNTTGAGFTFAKPFRIRDKSELIPSMNFNVYWATKQWFVHFLDGLYGLEHKPASLPGEELMRYPAIQPGAGLLWNSHAYEIGISGWYSLFQATATEVEIEAQTPYHILFYFTQKRKGTRKGLVSHQYTAKPEITVLYSENFFISRTGLRIERVDHLLGVFLQNDFTGKVHGIGGAFGWNFQNFKINFSGGGAYSFQYKKPTMFAEFNLGLIIPYLHINTENPWARPPDSL